MLGHPGTLMIGGVLPAPGSDWLAGNNPPPTHCAPGGRYKRAASSIQKQHESGRGELSSKRSAAPGAGRRGIMVLLKVSLLAVLTLVVCQMHLSHAAAVRPGLESMTDRVALSDYEARRLMKSLVKKFVQMTAEEAEQDTENNSMDRRMSKRCSGLSTCSLARLSEDLFKLQSYPHTDVGPDTPGKKRSAPSDPDAERYLHYGDLLADN